MSIFGVKYGKKQQNAAEATPVTDLKIRNGVMNRYPGLSGAYLDEGVKKLFEQAGIVDADDLIEILKASPLFTERVLATKLKKVAELEQQLATAKKAAGMA